MKTKPIGVFDSGLGGVTVLRELVEQFPHENFLYIGDTARLPYGSKSPETIRQYSVQAMQALMRQEVKAIVVACNSASTQIPETSFMGLPVITVIEPGACLAAQLSKGRVGLLGTRATVHSQAYVRALETQARVLQKEIKIFQQSAPLFVPLAEEGWVEDPVTNIIAYRYLSPLLQENIDTLILGCTHYPILRAAIAKVAGSQIQLIDSGQAVANSLRELMQTGVVPANEDATPASGKVEVQCTDWSEHFLMMAHALLDTLTEFTTTTVNL